MTTFTVQVKDSDAKTVVAILKNLGAKVTLVPKESKLTLEIVEALKEVKLIQEGKLKPLTLDDI